MARYRSPTAFEFVEEQCHDLSSGGMFIASPLPAPLGTLLKLECEAGGSGEAVRGVARVVWIREVPSDEGPRGMGVKFVKLDPGSREVIDRLVERMGVASLPPEAEEKAQERRSLAPGPRTSQAPQAPQAPAVASEAPAPPGSLAAAEPASAVETTSASDPGREPTQDRGRKSRPDVANLRERLERSRKSHEEIDTGEVLRAAAEARAQDEASPADRSRAEPAVASATANDADAAASESSGGAFTTAEALSGHERPANDAGTVDAQPVKPPSVRPAPTSAWPRPPGNLTLKIAVGVLLGYLVILFSPILGSDDDKDEVLAGTGAGAETDAPATPVAPAAPAEEPSAIAAQPSAPAMPSDPAALAALPAAVPGAAEAIEPPPVVVPDGVSYVVEVITTPEGARVSADNQRITAPGRLNLGALERPVKLLAELDGYAPTATLVERAGFTLVDGVMRRHVFLKLTPNANAAPQAVPAAPATPEPASAVAAPAASAPAAEAEKPSAPATPKTSKPSSTSKAEPPLQIAMACLAQGDNACVIKTLDGKAKTAPELELLIETFRGVGRTADAERSMELYVKRFPDERRAAAYRRLLERREAESSPPPAAPAAPAAPAEQKPAAEEKPAAEAMPAEEKPAAEAKPPEPPAPPAPEAKAPTVEAKPAEPPAPATPPAPAAPPAP